MLKTIMTENDWHAVTTKELVGRLETDSESGLSEKEFERRLAEIGANAITEEKVRRWPERLWRIATQPLLLLILAASVIYALLGEARDAVFLGFMIVPIILIQFIQEGRMEKAVASLKKLASPTAIVFRHGEAHEVPAEKIVPGDLLLLEAGRLIPADARIMQASKLALDESILTGESFPITKEPNEGLDIAVGISERTNMAYSGTLVVSGSGQAIVVETGMHTELGKVATLVSQVKERPTPLQIEINRTTKIFGSVGMIISLLVILVGVLQGRPFLGLALIAIGMAMAAIPEELPVILTVFLGLGVRRMSKRNALVKRVMGVETLGEVTVICSDKTGTITTGKMAVSGLWVADKVHAFKELIGKTDPIVDRLFEIGVRASDARFPEEKDAEPIGDPTEAALLIGARDRGIDADAVIETGRVVDELPFDSKNKRMVKTWELHGTREAYVKGAPEVLFDRCKTTLTADGEMPFDENLRRAAEAANTDMAECGLRVLALAYGRPEEGQAADENLVLAGLVGIEDPVRPEVKQAVDECHQAGIRVAMITGDQITTALAVARVIDIDGGVKALTGREIESMSSEELLKAVGETTVYARVTPEHKLRIVEALLENGEIVAMTGDGVNDAPALKKADIGVAMGGRGTDVARTASTMVLVDDNFATIVSAIKDGRTIYDNLKKATHYIIGLHVALLGIPLIATILGYVSPLLPATIILMELILDPMSSIVFESEPAEPDLMTRPPRRPDDRLINLRLGTSIMIQGFTVLIASLAVYIWSLSNGMSVNMARTVSFATLVVSQILLAINARSERHSIFQMSPFSNRTFNIGASIVFLILVGVVYVPFLQSLFRTAAFPPGNWLIVIVASILATFWVEIPKAIRRRRHPGDQGEM